MIGHLVPRQVARVLGVEGAEGGQQVLVRGGEELLLQDDPEQSTVQYSAVQYSSTVQYSCRMILYIRVSLLHTLALINYPAEGLLLYHAQQHIAAMLGDITGQGNQITIRHKTER